MNTHARMHTIALLASAFTVAAVAPSDVSAQSTQTTQELGRVHFQTSCTPQAQEKFDRGLAMVHSFVYPDSVNAFTEAAAAYPQFAIAYWGIAISHPPNPLILPLAPAVSKNATQAAQKATSSTFTPT